TLPCFTGLESRLSDIGFTIDISEDHTPALITYVAEMYEQLGGAFEAGRFLCNRLAGGIKMPDHCYRLIIARKIKE
ncbi:MAG: hypothetical protein PVG39_28700, partial [Desulfobacteraceae bacterium]